MNTESIILASASPRRVELLRQFGLNFEVIPSEVDENYVDGESPAEHVSRLAKKKGDKIAREHPHKWALSADTVVVLDGKILGKPADKVEAREMLAFLSGRTHEVYTGYYLRNSDKKKSVLDVVVSKVKIKKLGKDEINFYADTSEPYDKAGGYAVQGIGAFMVEGIDGSYTNVVGLPLCQVIDKLRLLGIVKLPLSE